VLRSALVLRNGPASPMSPLVTRPARKPLLRLPHSGEDDGKALTTFELSMVHHKPSATTLAMCYR